VASPDAPRAIGTGTLRADMWPRLSIFAGLLAGVAAAALVIGGILAFAPEPGAAVTPSPRPPATPTALPSLSPSPSPTASASGLPSGSPSPSVIPGATASGSGAVFHVGEPAPALVVPKVGGGTIDLATLRGKPVWINFMGTYCPPCVDEFPLMNGYATRYASTGLAVIAVDVREDEGTVAAFVEQLNTTFPVGLDADGSAAARWDAVTLPVHLWIDKDGVIRDGALGGIGSDVMAARLRTILPGVEVTP
jgi:cytochrome c biogenesis protein CcmG, thiol:disulfide interchange protein DsbE